jgi:hypothetical protein
MAYTREYMCMIKTQTINVINDKFIFHSKQRVKDLLADNALRSLQLHCTNTNCGKVNNFEGIKMYSNI